MTDGADEEIEYLVAQALALLNAFLKGSVTQDGARAWELVVAMQNVVDEMRRIQRSHRLHR